MSKYRWFAKVREILRAFRHFRRYEQPQADEPRLSRRERTRRFKAKLVLRYGTPNRCC